jgi:hypothetical protein
MDGTRCHGWTIPRPGLCWPMPCFAAASGERVWIVSGFQGKDWLRAEGQGRDIDPNGFGNRFAYGISDRGETNG